MPHSCLISDQDAVSSVQQGELSSKGQNYFELIRQPGRGKGMHSPYMEANHDLDKLQQEVIHAN